MRESLAPVSGNMPVSARFVGTPFDGAELGIFRTFIEGMSDAVVVTDANGRIVYANPAAKSAIFGRHAVAPRVLIWDALPDDMRTHDGATVGLNKVTLPTLRGTQLRLSFVDPDRDVRRYGLLTIDGFTAPNGSGGFILTIKDSTSLEEGSRIDALTGLTNRGEFDQVMRKEYERLKRGVFPRLSLLIVDVDHFKRFNDDHGHAVGDEVLRKVGAALRESVRAVDTAARFGGEEFSVLLPATDEKDAELIAERIRRRISAIRIDTEKGKALSVSASIGVATHQETACLGIDAFICEADEALYVAKRDGRNRVFVSTKPVP